MFRFVLNILCHNLWGRIDQRVGYELIESGYETSEPGYGSSIQYTIQYLFAIYDIYRWKKKKEEN